MNVPEWIAFGGLALALVGAVATGVIHAIRTAYTFGQHAQRMQSAEAKLEKLETTQDQHAKAISTWDQAMELLREVRTDLKKLMLERASSRRRVAGD